MSVIWSPQALDDVALAVDYLVQQDASDRASRLIELRVYHQRREPIER